MKISFFGSSLVSAYWNGAATYYRGIIRALNERGHEITFHEPDAYDRQQHRDISDPEWARVAVFAATEWGVEKALREARESDIVIKASGIGVFDPWIEQAVLDLGTRARIVFWDVDAPATLERLATEPTDPFHALIPRYDIILTYGGGQPVIDGYSRLGARRCVPIYNGLDPDTHAPAGPDQRFKADLGFMGNRLPDREARVHEFFLKPAKCLPLRRFVIGGNGWQQDEVPENVTCLGHVYTCDHNAFNSTAGAILNICRDSMARCGHSPATRVFEAAGAGACIITDCWEGLEEFFEPGKEWLVAQSGEDVADLLASVPTRQMREIGAAARARVLAQHTYRQRAEVVETLLREVL